MDFKHISVLYEECINALDIKDGGIYVDGTVGGGGHSFGILSRNDTCTLIGIDRDDDALKAAGERLKVFGDRKKLVKSNYCDIKNVLSELGIDAVDGVLLDLGVSSYQLDNPQRGFSYMHDAPLDMRMDTTNGKNAKDVVNLYSKEELTKIFYDYGEEKWSSRIADFIVRERSEKPIETTGELVEIIKSAVPAKARNEGGHPAKRVFQAIRIEVNNELGIIENAVKDIVSVLKPGGVAAIITFHSLEDRLVKNVYRELASGCICPKSFPVCVCGNKPKIEIITKKPILPSREETENNTRSKSAKLRVAKKL